MSQLTRCQAMDKINDHTIAAALDAMDNSSWTNEDPIIEKMETWLRQNVPDAGFDQ